MHRTPRGQLGAAKRGRGNEPESGIGRVGDLIHDEVFTRTRTEEVPVQIKAPRKIRDAQFEPAGDFGPEGGAPIGNLRQAAMAAGSRGGTAWLHGTSSGSGNFWTGGDGNGYVWANDSYSGCSYANDGGGVIC